MTGYEILSTVLTIIGIVVGIIISCFQVSISRSLKPDFSAKIQGTWTANISSTTDSALIFSATISNLGSPSIAEDYKLEIVFAGETKVNTYIPSILPERISGEVPASFGTGDAQALFDKTVHPIGSGDQAVGWLFFVIPNTKADKIHAPGTRITLLFKDIKGKQYRSEERVFSGKNDGSLNYLPGAGKPFSSPTK